MTLLEQFKRLAQLKSPADLGNGPVLSTLVRLAVPSIAMVFFHTLFHLVDTVFISWLGESYMAAISYTFPVQIGVFAVLEGVGNGMTALVGRRLGEGNLGEAQKITMASMSLAYLLVLPWLPFLFPQASDAFFRTLGATDAGTLHQAWLYNMWIPPLFVLISFSYVANSVFRCQGDTLTPLVYFLISNGANLILDPLFIFTFGWGIGGAAAATFLGRLIGTFYLIRKLRLASKIPVPFLPEFSIRQLRYWVKVVRIGFPVTISSASVALGMGSVNRILSGAFGQQAVAAWMVGIRVEDLAFNTLLGINNALVPFLAFNYGKRDEERMKKGVRSAIIISVAVTGTVGVLVGVFPFPMISLFRPTEDIARIAAQAIRITLIGYPMVIYSIIYNSLFIATGHSAYGMASEIFRSVILRIPAAKLLSALVSIGGIWWFQPISYLGAALMTAFFGSRLLKKIRANLEGRSLTSA